MLGGPVLLRGQAISRTSEVCHLHVLYNKHDFSTILAASFLYWPCKRTMRTAYPVDRSAWSSAAAGGIRLWFWRISSLGASLGLLNGGLRPRLWLPEPAAAAPPPQVLCSARFWRRADRFWRTDQSVVRIEVSACPGVDFESYRIVAELAFRYAVVGTANRSPASLPTLGYEALVHAALYLVAVQVE
jgi:hypothetical protein